MKKLEIRNDDILQVHSATAHQKDMIEGKSLFSLFKKADKVFEKYNYPCILAVLTEGIEVNTDWVKYIIRNQHRYQIELHGSSHLRYNFLTAKQGYYDLEEAIRKIENTFYTKVTTWYVPFGRRYIPEWGEKVCQELGIKMDVPRTKRLPRNWTPRSPYINFHYWHPGQVEEIKRIIEKLCRKK